MRPLVFCLCFFCSLFATAKPWEVDTDSRVVAFADVHGALAEFTELLQGVGVIDQQLNWSGGDTHLVSVGDLIDRGPDSRAVVELMMKLEQQAAAAGGAVHMVLGNHEVMVMSGDQRYVSREEYAAFAPDETAAERDALFERFKARQPAPAEGLPALSEEELRRRFDDSVPSGFIGLQKAYAPDGKLGRWLLQKPLVMRVNDKLYMHGGISNSIAESSIEEINENNMQELAEYLGLVASLRDEGVLDLDVDFWGRRVHLNQRAEAVLAADPKARPDWFKSFLRLTELESAFIFSMQSPIWYRGSAYCHPYAEAFNTERLLKRTGTRQLVIGHTPNPRGAISRMDGLVLRLDTGMLKSYYRGRATALVQQDGRQYLHYADAPEPAQPMVAARSISRELWGKTDAELERILLDGRIVSSEFIGTGVTKPKRLTLELDDAREDAVFKYEDTHPGLERKATYVARRNNDSDRYQYDPAAYTLDRLIDLQMVPVSVIRSVEGTEGTLGAWIPNAINERDRLELEVPFDGYCAKDEQYRLRFLFDVLIYNEDRNLTNIIWTKKDFMLRFIDHSLAFRSTERRPNQYRKVQLRVPDLFEKKLAGLTQEQLEATLSGWLHRRQIEAILARRDLILKEALRTDP